MSSSTVLVTGAAGFIGFHVAKKLLDQGTHVVGLDNVNDYYDVKLKRDRLVALTGYSAFKFYETDIKSKDELASLFHRHRFQIVIHLAAQAGVRYSLVNPYAYLDSNLTGFLNVLEACRHFSPQHLLYASSSSVYGGNKKMPFSVHDNVDHPLALYAASKKANELMAHAYSNLYSLPTTGLRFFTVYGPFGRPDMALFLFTRAILESKPIDIYNFGRMRRDFTYVDDIVDGIIGLMWKIPKGNSSWDSQHPDPGSSFAPYRVYNIGNSNPVELIKFIEVLEEKLGRKAIKNFLPLQDGDVPDTYADVQDLEADINFRPATSIETGIENFVAWYKDYYKVA